MPRTPVVLYRLGNASDPKMDNVRPKDIDTFDVNGETWVRAGTGGISTSQSPGPIKGKWWRLEAGYDYGVLLLVWNDHADHWSWEPAKDMRLLDFKDALHSTHPHFVRV